MTTYTRKAGPARWPRHQEESNAMTMLRTCVGVGTCKEHAEAYYTVKGFRTSNESATLALCDKCPDVLRAEGHTVEKKEA